MKKLITSIAILLFPLLVTAQIAVRQKFPVTDLEWDNVKGPAISIRTQYVSFKKAYGEWVSEGTLSNGEIYGVYNTKGNLIMRIEWDNVPSVLTFYHYNDLGNLDSADIYKIRNWDRSWTWPKEIESYKKEVKEWGYDYNVSHSVYEYKDGRLVNIITRKEEGPKWKDADGARDIFRYNDDGSFIMTRYNDYGSDEGSFEISADGHNEIRRENGRATLYVRDDEGKVVSYFFGVSAINANVTGGTYYGYNENGDLLVQSSSEKAIIDIEDLPWLKRVDDYGSIVHYEYENDSYGNWVTRKAFLYQANMDEPELREWKKRTIVYADEVGMTGEELLEKEIKDSEEKDRFRKEHPVVTFDGDLGETILAAILPNLPKIPFSEQSKRKTGEFCLRIKVSRDGVVEDCWEQFNSEYWDDRGDLIEEEAKRIIKDLSGSQKWIKGYDGVTLSVWITYYPSGKVTAEVPPFE